MAMASLIHRVILVQLLILSVATISATARPCKTLFISSYSFSFKPVNQQNPSSSSSSGFVTVFTEINHFNPKPQLQEQAFPITTEFFLFRDPITDLDLHCHHNLQSLPIPNPKSTPSSVTSIPNPKSLIHAQINTQLHHTQINPNPKPITHSPPCQSTTILNPLTTMISPRKGHRQ